VQQEIQDRLGEADRLRKTQVERAQYASQFWHNGAICASIPTTAWWPTPSKQTGTRDCASWLKPKQNTNASARRMNCGSMRKNARKFLAGHDFPRLWKDPVTPDRERKRMARLILET